MGIATHWIVSVNPSDTGRAQVWIEDFRLAQRARWDEIVHQLRGQDWEKVEAGIRGHGGDENDVRAISDCLYWNEQDHVAEFTEWYSINDQVFSLAHRTLADLGVRVSLDSLTISPEQLNRLLRVYSQHLTDETLIEVIAVKKAAS